MRLLLVLFLSLPHLCGHVDTAKREVAKLLEGCQVGQSVIVCGELTREEGGVPVGDTP